MTLPTLPAEVDTVASVREGLIAVRDGALKQNAFDIAVLMCHAIAWLHWTNEVLEAAQANDPTNAALRDGHRPMQV